MRKLQLFFTTVALFGFAFLALFGLMMHNGLGPMHNPAFPNCPYMADGNSICPMNTLNHIKTWKESLRLSPAKDIIALLSAYFILAFIFVKTKDTELAFLKKIAWYLWPFKFGNYPKPFLYQELFKKGILNPKTY